METKAAEVVPCRLALERLYGLFMDKKYGWAVGAKGTVRRRTVAGHFDLTHYATSLPDLTSAAPSTGCKVNRTYSTFFNLKNAPKIEAGSIFNRSPDDVGGYS